MIWLCLAVSLIADSMALMNSVSFPTRRNKMKAARKESQFATFKQDQNEIAQRTTASLLNTHATSDDGFTLVAGLRNDDAMEKYMRRLLLSYGKTVNDEAALKGFVPWFSGTKAAQNFSQMKEQLFKKQWVVDASDRPKESPPEREQSSSQGTRRPNRAHATWFSSSCGGICHAKQHMDVPWMAQHASNGVAGKCTWKDCSTCPECTPRQNLFTSSDIAEQYKTLWEDDFGDSEKSVSELESKSQRTVGFKQASVDCATTCYNDRHSHVQWEDHKCYWKRCSGCQECHTVQTPSISKDSLEATSESNSVSKSMVHSGFQESSPVRLIRLPQDADERHDTELSRNEVSKIPTATTPAIRQEAPIAVPSPSGSATVPVAVARPELAETSPAKEDLLLGVRSLVDSQSLIVKDITSKIEELKTNASKADSSNRKSLDEAMALYERKLLEQHMNTTRLRDINKHLEEDIIKLISSNAELQQQAQELKKQSFALRMQVTAVESNLTLAQEFAAKPLLDDSSGDFKFLEDLKRNESEAAQAQTHTLAVDHFERNAVALLQFENDTASVELLHTVEHTFNELSVQAQASKLALEQSYEHQFSQEAAVQESILAKQRALLDKRQEQLTLRSKLSDAVAHAGKLKTYLSNRILHLRSYALRLGKQHS